LWFDAVAPRLIFTPSIREHFGTAVEALLRYLPGPQPVAIRYGATAAIVLFAYGVRLGLGAYSGAYGFLFFILPVVASALMFDWATGFFAIALSGLLVWDRRRLGGTRPVAHVIALLLFAVVGACLVFISEGLIIA
jgi:hypothetical protein